MKERERSEMRMTGSCTRYILEAIRLSRYVVWWVVRGHEESCRSHSVDVKVLFCGSRPTQA